MNPNCLVADYMSLSCWIVCFSLLFAATRVRARYLAISITEAERMLRRSEYVCVTTTTRDRVLSLCELPAWVAMNRSENATKTRESILLRENVANPCRLHFGLLRIREQTSVNSPPKFTVNSQRDFLMGNHSELPRISLCVIMSTPCTWLKRKSAQLFTSQSQRRAQSLKIIFGVGERWQNELYSWVACIYVEDARPGAGTII